MACGEGYGSDVLARTAASVVGVDANPEAHEHARLRYARANLRFVRDLLDSFSEDADAVVFLQTIEHLEEPGAVLEHFRSLVGEGGAVFVSTPNVLTLAPKGASRSDNPWHVHEYRRQEFEQLCRAHFASVEMYGLFHARKLRAHELALRLGWDRVHARLGLTRRFYDWFTPAIAVSDFALTPPLAAVPAPRRRHGPGPGLPRGVPAVSRGRDRGALAIVLHTHMPYVEGFGTWPFGEEWLWEAIAGCYLPLLDLLDEGAPLTLSLTPVLCDQLEAPGVSERFAAFVEGVRRETHEEDAAGLRAGGYEALARELERSWCDYAGALESLRRRGGDLLGSLARHAQWTSSATHAILPLLATDAGVRLQVSSGVAAHRRRFGEVQAGAAASGCRSAPTRRGWDGRSRTPACAPCAWS